MGYLNLRHPELFGERRLSDTSRGVTAAYGRNVITRQFGPAVPFAITRVEAPLLDLVRRIVCRVTGEQVLWSDAGWIVAPMKDKLLRPATVLKKPANPVSQLGLTT